MSNTLPSEVMVQTTSDGVLYVLPPRDIGKLWYIALAVLLIGLGLTGLAVYLILIRSGLLDWLMDLQSSGGNAGSFDLSGIPNIFWALPCLFFGVPILKFGRFMMGGKSSIEVSNDHVITTQGSGLLRRRKKYAIEKIKKLQVKTSRPGDTGEGLSELSGALNIVLKDGKTRNLTWGYQKALLTGLASDLSAQCKQSEGAVLYDGEYKPITIEQRTIGDRPRKMRLRDDVAVDGESFEDAAQPRPDNAVAVLEHHQDGLTITVPPVGIRKGSKGLFGFSIFWNVFMIVFTGAWFGAGGVKLNGELLMILAFLSVFWAVGIGTMLAAINAGRRQAILDVVGDTLLITRQNIFKTRQEEVRRDNIESIRRDKSGTEVNDVPILNLQVHRKQGKKIAMLSQLSNDELAWIASELRQALDVPGR